MNRPKLREFSERTGRFGKPIPTSSLCLFLHGKREFSAERKRQVELALASFEEDERQRLERLEKILKLVRAGAAALRVAHGP